eukprot:12816_1
MDTLSKRAYLSLYKFTSDDICVKIKEWVYNDIDYQNNLKQMQKLFIENELDGQKIIMLSTINVKLMVANEIRINNIMTSKTINVVFDSFQSMKNKDIENIQSRSAHQMAEIFFNIPLNNLLKRFTDEHENIDGETFIQMLNKNDIIATETGWSFDEVYQVQSIILKHITFKSTKFKNHVENVLLKKCYQILTETIRQKIEALLLTANFDIENLHFKIKNARNIDDFSDKVINMIDDLLESKQISEHNEDNVIQKIYEAISECFIFSQKSKQNKRNSMLSVLQRQYEWICSDCG